MEIDLNNHLDNLHYCHKVIANEIKRICEKHNIKYFIIAGTLLGAVRHKGFIPWDDDMDIGMLRTDYERFVFVAKTEMSDIFELQSFETDPNYGLPFLKVLLKNTKLVEASGAENSAKKGIFVDVFPFDAAPDDLKLREKHNKKTYLLKRLFLAKQKYKVYSDGDVKKKVVYAVLGFMAAFLSKEKLYSLLNKEIKRYNGENTTHIVNIGGAYGYNKECIKAEWVESVVSLPFGKDSLSAPAGYTEYLEYFYGDYMTPPPEDKRYNRHGLLELDFGPFSGKK